MSWVSDQADCISLIKGKTGVVQVYDTSADSTISSKDYSSLFSKEDKKHIVGVHSLSNNMFFMSDNKGNGLVDNINSKKSPKKTTMKVKGDTVHKTVQSIHD